MNRPALVPVAVLLLHNRTLDHLLSTYAYGALFGMVAIESLGVPLPGETMLIAAALYAGATGRLHIGFVIAVAAAAAISGDNVGFAIGRYGGSALLERLGRHARIGERRLAIGRYLFRRHGGGVVFAGRFVSILRTYAAFLAGAYGMGWRRFLVFNAVGGVVWATLYGAGYYLAGQALAALQAPVDIALGAAAALVGLGVLVYAKRKESELAARAERDLRRGSD